jgi:hypothetical protein
MLSWPLFAAGGQALAFNPVLRKLLLDVPLFFWLFPREG